MQIVQQTQKPSNKIVLSPLQNNIIKLQKDDKPVFDIQQQNHFKVNQQELGKGQLNDVAQDANFRKKCGSIISNDTIFTCWLCNDEQKGQDPFISNCNCTGSNNIHVSCLIQFVLEDTKKKKQKPHSFQRKLVRLHQCSICKHQYQSLQIYKYTINCRINCQNIWLFIIGLMCLIFSICMMAISYYVLFKQEGQGEESTIQSIYIGFIIFLKVLCILIFMLFLILALFMFYKTFIKQYVSTVKIFSSIKTRVIECNYDNLTQKYVYNQQQSQEYIKKNTPKSNKIVPNNQIIQNTPMDQIKFSQAIIEQNLPPKNTPHKDEKGSLSASRQILQDDTFVKSYYKNEKQNDLLNDIEQQQNRNDENLDNTFN